MKYVNVNTQEILTINDIRSLNPNTSFPEGEPNLEDFGYAFLVNVTPPTYNPIIERLVESTPELNIVDGQWYQTWEIEDLPPEEAAINQAAYEANLRRTIVDAVMKRLDDFAATRNYSSIFSACTYVTSTVPKFQEEATYCVSARDNTWVTCYQILDEINAGTRPVPSGYQDIEGDLPELIWPPTANFSADITSGAAPLTVTFTSTTTDAQTFAWDFTNNGSTDETTANAEYTYTVPGTYSVKLTVTNPSGTKEVVKTSFITVT
jgi:hypothetical protein